MSTKFPLQYRLQNLWAYLSAPHQSITDVERRKQSQLLASFAVVLMLVVLVSGVISLFYFRTIVALFNFVAGLSLANLVFAFNRRGHYLMAARLMISGFFVVIHLALFAEAPTTIFYVILLILICGIFLSLQAAVAIACASIGIQIGASVNKPPLFSISRIDAIVFAIVSMPLIIVFVTHRRSVERAQQAELRASNIALKESEARWRSLVENAPDFILEIDLNLNVRFINSIIPNLKSDDVLGKHIDTFVAPEYKGLITEKVQSVIDINQPMEFEVEGLNANNTISWYSNMVNPILRDNVVIGVTMISRDISVRKKVEAERLAYQLEKERVRALEELIGNLSHDLKTPLGTIRFSLSMLEQLADPQAQQLELDTIRNQATRLERLIQNILTMSRLDHIPDISRERVDLNAIANNIAQTVRPTSFQKKVTTIVEFRDPVVVVIGDETELDRAIANLVENALYYTPDGGSITIKTYRINGHCVIEITDTGIGIAEDDLPKIFDRFYRSSTARQSRKGGTGLGLAIVQRIVEMHNGKIEVETKIGDGTTFRIILPSAARLEEVENDLHTDEAGV
jgi:PAS domain S-box-containing protein